jgi:hypothetical protein
MPVLPLVGSITVPPLASRPLRSAASIIERQMRSFTEPPGFCCSIFAQMVARQSGSPSRRIRTSGVSPMSGRTLSTIIASRF